VLVIEIKVLGEFEATYDGNPIALQPMQHVVILVLLCAGGLLTRDRMVQLLWDRPSAGSVKTLHTHLSRIGKGVQAAGGSPDELVVTVPLGGGRFGYRLAGDLEVDAEHFRRLVDAGSDSYRQGLIEEAGTQLSDALKLRERGRPAVEVAGRPFAVDFIHGLDETYKTALIASFKVGITLGRHREAVGQLRQLARRWPGEGEIWELLAHALYRSDRMAEASDVCREAIDTMRAEGADDRFFLDLQRDVLQGVPPKRGPLPAPLPASAEPGRLSLAG
jgi:DNA-binding SARP family transcriptional activator